MQEMNVIRLLQSSQIYNFHLLIYYAQLINDQILASFEYESNRYVISNFEELLIIIHNLLSSFQINGCLLKEILRFNFNGLSHFLRSISTDLRSRMYYACLSYHY